MRWTAIACCVAATVAPAAPPADWTANVSNYLRVSEYHFRQLDDGSWSAPNRAQDLRISVSEGGVWLRSRTEAEPSWQLGLHLTGVGRAGALAEPGFASADAEEARLELRRSSVTEWYLNSPRGIEQGFDVAAPPPRDGGGEGSFVLELGLAGGASAFPHPEGRSVVFKAGSGRPLLRYAGLKVTDGAGRLLDAWLETSPGALRIVVDDAGATYPLAIDPLMTNPSWTAIEPSADNLGISVAAAGDVDGDGYSDVIVGDDRFDGGETDEGRALVYLGSASGLSTTPAWAVEGNQAGALFAAAVAGAGDVNGDGYDDVIVGAPEYDGDLTAEGRAFVYAGSAAGLATTPLWFAEGNQAEARFGKSVSAAGDTNADGYDDVIVSAPFWPVTNRLGFVQAFYGSAGGPSTVANWTRDSPQQGNQFGWSVASAGDINGDGYGDVIIGAPRHQQGHADNGRAWTHHGGGLGLSFYDTWAFSACCGFNYFGHSVSAAGDVDGDGYGDVIVGEPGSVNNSGRVRVFRGGPLGLISSGHWSLTGDQANARLGDSVGAAGDVNGDGYADVVFGAPDHVQVGTSGAVWVHAGSAAGVSDDAYWERLGQTGEFGRSVGTAGDVDGDGHAEVLVGALNRAFAFHGSGDGPSGSASWTAEGGQPGAGLGLSVSGAGDVNGDGYWDVIVGAPLFDGGLTDEGRVLVFLGSGAGPEPTASWSVEGEQAGAQFGRAVSSAGDVDGDGLDDVIVGAPWFDDGETDEGRASVFLGGSAGPAAAAAWNAYGDQAGARLGFAVARAGDVNGDGRSDVIVGAPRFDGAETDAGRASVFLGTALGPEGTASWSFEGEQADEHLGESVATAGDVNGDGSSDVIVGAPGYDDRNRADAGRALAFHGSNSGPSALPDWVVDSGQAGARFGAAVSRAGDVDGDGYGDVIVGAPLFDSNLVDEGVAFVYLGSSSGLAQNASWTAERDTENASFGESVSAAGDVNNDGYSDLVVGSPGFFHPITGGGLALVYAGSATGPGSDPLWVQGPPGAQPDAGFGRSVSWAGDVNGDGFQDVLVGADSYDGGQTDEGGAFVYLGNESDGVDRRPRQVRSDGSAPVATLGKSDSDSAFRLEVTAQSPAGRRPVRLEWEVKPLGVAFDGSGTGASQIVDPGAPGPGGSTTDFDELVDGLDVRTPYRWRLRLVTDDRLFPRSPWFSHAGNALTSTDLTTAGCLDQDGDGFGLHGDSFCAGGVTPDCDDGDPGLWSAPGEVRNVAFAGDKATLGWDPPSDPGGTGATLYDTLRSTEASDFSTAVCIESDDGADTVATDTEVPAVGAVFHYLVRAENACPGGGSGTPGSDSSGAPRIARDCP